MLNCTRILGIDIGDLACRFFLGDSFGEKLEQGKVLTSRTDLLDLAARLKPDRIMIEVGTHSPWISWMLGEAGFEVVVLNARQLRLLTSSVRKSDKRDASVLAWIGTLSTKHLLEVQHCTEQSMRRLLDVKARARLVEARTGLINSVRGLVKPLGERISSCDADYFHRRRGELSEPLQELLGPMFDAIAQLTETIAVYDKRIDTGVEESPEAQLLVSVPGVGPVTALTFVATIEDPARFANSRQVGAWLGMVPKRDQSGMIDKSLRITKAGNPYLRSLLVQSAHTLLRSNSRDCALKQWGLALASKGVPPDTKPNKATRLLKRKAVVAVARKLAALLHHLWVTGQCFEPFPNQAATA